MRRADVPARTGGPPQARERRIDRRQRRPRFPGAGSNVRRGSTACRYRPIARAPRSAGRRHSRRPRPQTTTTWRRRKGPELPSTGRSGRSSNPGDDQKDVDENAQRERDPVGLRRSHLRRHSDTRPWSGFARPVGATRAERTVHPPLQSCRRPAFWRPALPGTERSPLLRLRTP